MVSTSTVSKYTKSFKILRPGTDFEECEILRMRCYCSGLLFGSSKHP